MKTIKLVVAVSLSVLLTRSSWAAEDFLNFYQEEAKVVSASQVPQPAAQAPATVHVVTQDDIRASGARTVWDAIRNVPGVEVMHTRTTQPDVGIRGLNRPLGNRVLVLMDGRSVLNAYISNITWESLPLTMEEIDRIEVVSGPASSVYGADALSGVINIITKKPEALQGGQLSYSGGENQFHQTNFVYGRRLDKSGFRVSSSWDMTNRFENENKLAGTARMGSGYWEYHPSEDVGVSVSGGINRYQSTFSLGQLGVATDKGYTNFARTDAKWKGTSLRAFWNRQKDNLLDNSFTRGDGFSTDTYDVTLQQAIDLPMRNQVVLGGGYRKNVVESPMLTGTKVKHDLLNGVLEDRWQMADRWLLMLSGRADHHPLTGWQFSPRGSLVYTPATEHVFRISGGRSYRQPTLVENYLDRTRLPVTGSPYRFRAVGNQDLDMVLLDGAEISHEGRFRRWRTQISGFYYDFHNSIGLTGARVVSVSPLTLQSNVFNAQLDVRALGSEVSVEYFATSWLRLFQNYTYQSLKESSPTGSAAPQSPRHRTNTGFRVEQGGWRSQWSLHWWDQTTWPNQLQTSATPYRVPAFFTLDANASYAFAGRLKGLELSVTAFNLLDNIHYETDPVQQGGEKIERRLFGTISYKF